MENKDIELKPCPFCCSTNIEVLSGHVRFDEGFTWNHNMVRCKECNGMVLVSAGESAVDIWNKRVTC